jgi:hypothetical protein
MVASEILVVRASLRARLYRDIEIRGSQSLENLAEAIVSAFGFTSDHAYGFYSRLKGRLYDSPIKYELFADLGASDAGSVVRTPVASAFPEVGAKMTFLFDYGDEWRFMVELIGMRQAEPGAQFPRVVAIVGKAPEQYPGLEVE